MSSKAKKAKKKSKSCSDATKANKKIYAYFTSEEIAEIKAVTKMKDVTSVPFVVAATFLHKLDLLRQLLKDGYNVNQTGQNNMTALMWAVKHKCLDIVEFLLNSGADPTIKTDSGDNVLILALEHKLWDQESMINLWKAVKRVSFIDVNFTNKNGHNMLHMCVRRDWEALLKLLLTEKPNVDAPNSNGVTPLMLACFRNNITIIDILIATGASVLKEDNHGRMTLCYAISSSIKTSKPPFPAIDRIIAELEKTSSISTYLTRRLELIISTASKSEISCATAEMFTKIVQFAVQFMNGAVGVFVEGRAFTQLFQVIKTRLGNPPVLKFLLEVCAEILFYNEQSVGYNRELHDILLDQFFDSGIDVLLLILQSKSEEAKIALEMIILAFTNSTSWNELLENNNELLKTYLNDHQTPSFDETRFKILKTKKRKLKKSLERLGAAVVTPDQNQDERKRTDGVNYSKKSKRRSKAIRAKLSKMKSAELTKRLSLNMKKFQQQKPSGLSSPETASWDLSQKSSCVELENPIVASFQYLLNGASNESSGRKSDELSQWRKKLKQLSKTKFCKEPLPIDRDKLLYAVNHLKHLAFTQIYDVSVNRSVNIVIDYLRHLVQLIAKKYREHWDSDSASGSCNCLNLNEHVPWFYSKHLEMLKEREKQALQELHKSFEQFVKAARELSHKDLNRCLKAINEVESTVLNYEIRGIKVMSYVCGIETFTMKYLTCAAEIGDDSVVTYMQNVANGVEEERQDIEIEVVDETVNAEFPPQYKSETPPEICCNEGFAPSEERAKNKRKEIEAKLNTIANGFHLINSIMSVCDETIKDKKLYGSSDLNHPLPSKPKKLHYPKTAAFMPKRLRSQIANLQSSTNLQSLLDGQIRIAPKEQRVHFIISAGTNFNAIEMGLDINDQPLAVKRVPRKSWIGKILKTLVEPLLGLVHRHLLHYFMCEFEGDELILATPLCKWTIAQYVQLFRQNNVPTMPALTSMQIVKQFLDGLCVLHRCDVPIVHGNLKPSNIFIDFNGKVKIGEFGIYKALYKIIEAPKSSLIWFAKETLEVYKSSSIVECSSKSDIQVAGMVMYFILSCGKHPFGDDADEILKNIQRGIPKLNTRNIDFRDLLLWMLLSDFNERPNIENVLSHTFFWSPTKKWSFITACAGINHCDYIVAFNVDMLHRSIDAYCDAYIKLDWYDIFANKYPFIRITETNTVSGLLRFIKNFYAQIDTEDLSCAVLTLFPALPVALYRTLQHTNWLKHAVFMPFSEVF